MYSLEKLNSYNVYFFDFDGVIVDSNIIKYNAFVEVCEEYAPNCVNIFSKYLVDNGGVNRTIKFQHLLKLMNQESNENLRNKMLETFASKLKSSLLNAKLVDGVEVYLKKLKFLDKRVYIISAGNTLEIVDFVKYKKIEKYFFEIYGNLIDKSLIINEILEKLSIRNAIIFGDSLSDLKASIDSNLEFCWVAEFAMNDLTNYSSESIHFKINNFIDLIQEN